MRWKSISVRNVTRGPLSMGSAHGEALILVDVPMDEVIADFAGLQLAVGPQASPARS
jgi:hypothetical protein